jgi:hypothetical protein
VFNELFNILFHQAFDGVRLDEALSATELATMRDELSTPEVLPCVFDVTIPGWMARIELWGRISIVHKDPETFCGKRNVTKKQFIDRISDESLTKMLGKWSIKKNGMTSVTFVRDYVGLDGKHYKEELIIDVDLKPELR